MIEIHMVHLNHQVQTVAHSKPLQLSNLQYISKNVIIFEVRIMNIQ